MTTTEVIQAFADGKQDKPIYKAGSIMYDSTKDVIYSYGVIIAYFDDNIKSGKLQLNVKKYCKTTSQLQNKLKKLFPEREEFEGLPNDPYETEIRQRRMGV